MRRLVPFLIIVLIGGFIFFFLQKREEEKRQDHIIVSGNIEATEVDCSFKIPGRIERILFEEGDVVKKGTLIARLDSMEIEKEVEQHKAALKEARSRLPQLLTTIEHQEMATKAQIEQANAGLEAARAKLEEMLTGSRPQEIKQAEAQMRAALSDLKNMEAEWNRAETLYRKGIISQQKWENTRTAYEVARERYEESKERYAVVKEGPRKEQIDVARSQVNLADANLKLARTNDILLKRYRQELETLKAQIERIEAQLRLSEIRLMETYLYAPITGIVLVKGAEQKEVIPAGTPVLTLGDLENVWLKAYIPETEIGRIRIGQEVMVKTDSFPHKVYRGRISFIASKAEFTPKNVQTQKERVKLVYRIKIALENPNMELKPGMPADCVIELKERS